jgi:hypothetical protein
MSVKSEDEGPLSLAALLVLLDAPGRVLNGTAADRAFQAQYPQTYREPLPPWQVCELTGERDPFYRVVRGVAALAADAYAALEAADEAEENEEAGSGVLRCGPNGDSYSHAARWADNRALWKAALDWLGDEEIPF